MRPAEHQREREREASQLYFHFICEIERREDGEVWGCRVRVCVSERERGFCLRVYIIYARA